MGRKFSYLEYTRICRRASEVIFNTDIKGMGPKVLHKKTFRCILKMLQESENNFQQPDETNSQDTCYYK